MLTQTQTRLNGPVLYKRSDEFWLYYLTRDEVRDEMQMNCKLVSEQLLYSDEERNENVNLYRESREECSVLYVSDSCVMPLSSDIESIRCCDHLID
jgi:hypothetical protein